MSLLPFAAYHPSASIAYQAKRLGYAALDVYANEPRFDNRLRDLPNVILQPHQATAVLEARIAMGQLVIDNLAAHFGNAPLLSPIHG